MKFAFEVQRVKVQRFNLLPNFGGGGVLKINDISILLMGK